MIADGVPLQLSITNYAEMLVRAAADTHGDSVPGSVAGGQTWSTNMSNCGVAPARYA